MKEPMITAPAMELTPQAIDNLVEELREGSVLDVEMTILDKQSKGVPIDV